MQRPLRGLAAALLLTGFALLAAGRASFAQRVCAGDEPLPKNSPNQTNVAPDFTPYRVPALVSCNANRDINFLWSSTYQTMFGVPMPTADLDQFGITLTETYKNPFNFPMSDIQLVHDYEVLRRSFRDSVYQVCPNLNGFRVLQSFYPDAERNHVDSYLYTPKVGGFPGDDPSNYGRWPSFFTDPDEDAGLTGFHNNSTSITGPLPSQIGVGGPNAWYRPDGPLNSVWIHEFQHDLNAFGGAYGEMYSSISQTISGAPLNETNPYDVPFTTSLLATTFSHNFNNYYAWEALGAYVAFDFRGADTTFVTRNDDLLWRWTMASGSGAPNLTILGQQLVDSRCTDCAAKFPAGVTSAKDRREVLVHNWRVYNYVDNPNLAQGQYGIPPNFGPSPSRRLQYWRDNDGCCFDNALAIPPETTLTATNNNVVVTSSRTVTCSPDACGSPTPLTVTALDEYGSEYWIVRSDASLNQAGNRLVIKVEPTAVPPAGRADRLMVSVVGYSNSVDGNGVRTQLWTKPDWAQTVVGPQWIDTRTQSCSAVELQLPNFGTTNKAALVVITLGSSGENEASNNAAVQPFRLTMKVEQGTACTLPAPTALITSPTLSDERGAFNPAGTEVVWSHYTPGAADGRIYRKTIIGGFASQLVPGTPAGPQATPDWSPRGDWVTYEQDTPTGDTHVWLYNTETGENRQLTSSTRWEAFPAFSPNGQEIAYSHGIANGSDVWELRRVTLDGSANSVVYASQFFALSWPRWSPDGSRIYFVRNDSLFAVNTGGTASQTPVFIPKVQPSFYSYDLPLGTGPFATEDINLMCSGTHLGLQDTLALTRIHPFEQSGKNLTHPHWAYDGIRLIYGAASTTSGDVDLYIASSSCNHAPVLSAGSKADVEIFPCQLYQRTLSATDADGDPITYQAAYLPPGATFSGNRFRWTPSSSQALMSFFVVFRALDNKGGASNAVVRIDTNDACVICPRPPFCLPAENEPVVDEDLPQVYELKQNAPNPFADQTRIGFDVPQTTHVKIDVYDIQGRLVRSLADRVYRPGHWSIAWNREDAAGYRVPLGVYFYRARMGSYVSDKKMMVLK
jgi:Tol biopolymer transport system component